MDTYEIVTSRIIAQLEQGTIPWKKPWSTTAGCISYVTGKPYSLLNQLLLECRAGEYLTFNQARKLGGNVKRGEHGHPVVFWKWLKATDEVTGEEAEIPFLKSYIVFNTDQCEGISPRFIASQPVHSDLQPDVAAEKIIQDYVARSGVTFITRESNEAYYSPAVDTITVPLISQFKDLSLYYSTVFHETVHSTGHEKRLNRIDTVSHFGDEKYSREELIAEIGSSYLLNHCGLETSSSFNNNAAYLENWLKVLKSDKRFIVMAAGKAEKAAKLILGEEDNDDVGTVET